jgi:hypothetical protein
MAIIATQKVLTLDYWKFADKLEVGDYVFNKDGKIVTITKIHKYFSEECYEVIFNDHVTMQGDKHLGFLLETHHYRKQAGKYKGRYPFKNKLKFTKLEDLIDLSLRNNNKRLEYSVPMVEPLEFPSQSHAVPAFIFAYWFFNTKLIPAKEAEELIYQKFKDYGYKIYTHWKTKLRMQLTPTIESQLAPFIPTRIPENYLMGSVEERTNFLSGVIYAKPKQYKRNEDAFVIHEKHLSTALRLQNLIESLGISCILDKNIRGQYILSFKTNLRLIEWQKPKVTRKHYARRYIKAIKPIQSQMCVHIETSEEDNSLVVGEGYIATC